MDERATLREPTDLRGHGIPILARQHEDQSEPSIAGYVIAVAGTALVTIAFLPFRDDITPLSKGFAYLAVVVAAAATGELGAGIAASVLGFLASTTSSCRRTAVDDRPAGVRRRAVRVPRAVGHHLGAPGSRRGTCRSAEAREAELRTIQELSRELTTRVPGEDTIEAALLDGEARVRLRGRGVLRRADRGRARPGPAGDGRGFAGIASRRRGTRARRSSRPNDSRSRSEDGCSGSSS